MKYDYVIKNVQVVDGTGEKSFLADVGITDDKISAIGQVSSQGSLEIDGSGLTLSPGFIDVHNHSDAWVIKTPNFVEKISQGFTTEVLMSDGISYAPVTSENYKDWIYYLRSLNALELSEYKGWKSFEDFYSLLDNKTVQNIVPQVPYANIRSLVCGWTDQPLNNDQIEEIKKEIRICMEYGAPALSTGLEYINQCFTSTEELTNVCAALTPFNGLYVTHIRYPLGIVEGLKEAVEICKKNKIPLHVSHLKGPTEEVAEEILKYIDNVAINEVDFSFDVYPFNSASTMLHYLLPAEIWKQGPLQARNYLTDDLSDVCNDLFSSTDFSTYQVVWVPDAVKQIQGKFMNQLMDEYKLDAYNLIRKILLETEFSALLVIHRKNDEVVNPFLQHKTFMLGTDGVFFPNAPVHPRFYCSVSRILGDCVKKHKLFSLEEAVQKLAQKAAQRFRLEKRGEIKIGNFADLCLFDSNEIGDEGGRIKGIKKVFVNGELVFGGESLDLNKNLPGRVLRCS